MNFKSKLQELAAKSVFGVLSGKAKFDAAREAAERARLYRGWSKLAFNGKSREYAREEIARARKLVKQGKIQIAGIGAGVTGLGAGAVASKKEFSEKERSGLQKAGIAAGIGAAAVGAGFMPAAARLWRIQAREAATIAKNRAAKTNIFKKFVKSPPADPNRGGKIVADYSPALLVGGSVTAAASAQNKKS